MSLQQHVVETEWGGRTLTIETGTLAGQASGAVTVRYGDTIVLVAATMSERPRDLDFFPLTVDFEERMYAIGKIPGSRFLRREGRPSEHAILSGRIIDRSIRPLFPKGAANDVQVVITTLSVDTVNSEVVPALIGASAALTISGIPWKGPIVGCKVGLDDQGNFILNPTYEQIETGGMELVVAGHADGLMMIEGDAREVPEDRIADALQFAQDNFGPILELQRQLKELAGKPERTMIIRNLPADLLELVESQYAARVDAVIRESGKASRDDALNALRSEVVAALNEQAGENAKHLGPTVDKLVKKHMRAMILQEKIRVGGRGLDELRPLTAAVSLLPRTHGTGLFSRGETQVLNIATLGSVGDAKLLDDLTGVESKRFLHHYNFPPYSTGEAKMMRGAGRREIGHGALAERSLVPVIPAHEIFPYTIRLVSEVLSSNGSTSMASVCSGTLSLMDAGVPITAPVAGISIGLVTGEDGQYELLTDIQGIEDFYGDMDFKVAGTKRGMTGIQLDLKLEGVTIPVFRLAFQKALAARVTLLAKMAEAIAEPRAQLSEFAPRILTTSIPNDRIGELIGPGGKNVRGLQERFNVKIDIEEDGTVFISSVDAVGAENCKAQIDSMMREVEIGEVYRGRVVRLLPIGAFVEILPGKDGLVHISQWAWERTENIEDAVEVGDEVEVKVVDIDEQNRINLSRKALLPKPANLPDRPQRDRDSGDRGGRPGGGGGRFGRPGGGGGGPRRGGGFGGGGGGRDRR